jgi:hypothetical protein
MSTPAVPPALRRLLADRDAVPRASDLADPADARASAMLRAHALAAVSRALADAGLRALLVKGAALALTVYPDPAARPMRDLDLLVRPEDEARAVAALVARGGRAHAPGGRAHSAALLGETQIMLPLGALQVLVEVHATLDKIAPRPIDLDAIFSRAAPAPGLPALLVPAPEDHALLLALHAAVSGFAHPIAFLDLELLLRRGLDARVLAERARDFGLRAAMFATLSIMRDLGAASLTPDLLARFDPGPARRALLRRASPRAVPELGLAWIAAQTPLRDDLPAWLGGVARYAVARARDRVQDAPVRYRVPIWVRAFLAADRAALKLDLLRDGVRDELFLAFVPEADRAALTAALYSDQSAYLPGGSRFRRGLFGWEKKVFDSPIFPKSGRVLVGAAGAGREVMALVERGFSVFAFDPCKPFVDAARTVAPPDKVTFVHASYRDLVDAAAGRGGPLADLCQNAPFDAVVLGWGSLSHVMPASERLALLRAVHAVAPRGPVLASFSLDEDRVDSRPGKGRVRGTLRRVFSALGAPGTSEDGDHFYANIGFFANLRNDDIVQLAWDSGYEVALFEESPYAHAVLVPLGAEADRGVTRKP